MHRGVLDGERRSARRPHRRLDRRRAGPDADRPGPPAAAQRGPGDHPGARGRGRLQRPVRAVARLHRVRGDRGQPARLALVGARLEGDRLSDRPGRGPDRGRAAAGRDPERGHRHDRGRVRAGARLRRGQAAALPVRQVPDRRSHARQPDEGHRRGDGDRPDVRLGAQQGAARARAGRRRAAGRGPGLGADASTTWPASTAGDPDADEPIRWVDESGPGLRVAPGTRSGRRRRSSCAGSSSRPTAGCGGSSGCSGGACRRRSSARHRDLAVVPGRDGPQRRARGRGRSPGPRLADPTDADAAELLATVKRAGFGDRELAGLAGTTPDEIRAARLALGLRPGYAMVDTVRRRVRRRDAVLLLDLRRGRVGARRRRRSGGRPRSSSAPGRSGSGRGSSSTTARSRPPTRSAAPAGRRS